MVEKSLEIIPVYIYSVDMIQAFDWIRWSDIRKQLNEKGINPYWSKILEDITRVCERIYLANRIRQGESLNPLLFDNVWDNR